MSDDWKGEHHLRIKVSKEQRYVDDQRVIQKVVHKKRQAEGRNMSRSGGIWATSIRLWHKIGKIEGGKKDD